MTNPDLDAAQTVRINGVFQPWRPNWTLPLLLEELEATGHGVAVERNREVVRRAEYANCVLQPGDEVEIVRLVGGG